MTRKVLFADTNLYFCEAFETYMKSEGLSADYSHTVPETLKLLTRNMYALLVMDINLPDIADGLGLIRVVKQILPIPILVLSENLSTDETRDIFHAGADVHMEKSVDLNVCIAQVQSLVTHYGTLDEKFREHDIIAYGMELVICPLYRQVLVNGNPLHLTRAEFNILHLLARSPRQVFTLEQLHNHLWSNEFSYKGDDAIRTHIMCGELDISRFPLMSMDDDIVGRSQ